MSAEPWSAPTFERRYREDPDPWDFAASPYEQGRYDAIVRSLGRPRYGRAYEPACSVGALTVALADRCDHLVATDVSATAISVARERGADRPGVPLAVGSVVDAPPPDLDLVVLSEVGYYLEPDELAATADRLVDVLRPGGELVACHWLGRSPDHRLTGNEAHDVLRPRFAARLIPTGALVTPGYAIETWRSA